MAGLRKNSDISRCQRVDFTLRHFHLRAGEVFGFEVAHEQAVRLQKEGVIPPAAFA